MLSHVFRVTRLVPRRILHAVDNAFLRLRETSGSGAVNITNVSPPELFGGVVTNDSVAQQVTNVS